MFPDRVIYFGENLGDQLKGLSTKKLKSLIEVPFVLLVKVQVISFNMILISSPKRVPRPSYTFPGKFGWSGKGSFTVKAKIVDRSSICSDSECTGSKASMWTFSFLRSVFLDRFIHFGKNFGGQAKDLSPKKGKLLIEVPYLSHLKIQVLIFNMNLFSSP